jgi:hypothetical protein
MATTSTSHPTAPAPSRRDGSPRLARKTRRRVAWTVGGLALCAGVVGVLVLGPDKNPTPEHFSSAPAQRSEQLVEAPLGHEARQVAVRFIQTAVARKNLDEAWTLVGPNLRGGLSKKRWMTGENPVVPYPVDKLDVAPYKVDASYTKSALLEVALLPRKGSGVRAQVFFLELRKVGSGRASRWVVDNWVPRASAVVPR